MPKPVLVPPLGTTVDTVTLVSWYKKEGEEIRKGEPLFVIETDKANLDVESPASGRLYGVTAQEGDEVKALTVIAHIAEEGEAFAQPIDERPSAAASAKVSEPVRPAGTLSVMSANRGDRVFISPRARRLAEANHIPLNELHATGPEGAIIERDVRHWMEAHSSVLASQAAPQKVAAPPVLSSARWFISAVEVDLTSLVALGKRLRSTGITVSDPGLALFVVCKVLNAFPLRPRGEPPGMISPGLLRAGEEGFTCVPVDTQRQHSAAELSAWMADTSAQANSIASLPPGSMLAFYDAGTDEIDTFFAPEVESACMVISLGQIRWQDEEKPGYKARSAAWLSLSANPVIIDYPQAARFIRSLVRFIKEPELLVAI